MQAEQDHSAHDAFQQMLAACSVCPELAELVATPGFFERAAQEEREIQEWLDAHPEEAGDDEGYARAGRRPTGYSMLDAGLVF